MNCAASCRAADYEYHCGNVTEDCYSKAQVCAGATNCSEDLRLSICKNCSSGVECVLKGSPTGKEECVDEIWIDDGIEDCVDGMDERKGKPQSTSCINTWPQLTLYMCSTCVNGVPFSWKYWRGL